MVARYKAIAWVTLIKYDRRKDRVLVDFWIMPCLVLKLFWWFMYCVMSMSNFSVLISSSSLIFFSLIHSAIFSRPRISWQSVTLLSLLSFEIHLIAFLCAPCSRFWCSSGAVTKLVMRNQG